jgi:hypothetical protein
MEDKAENTQPDKKKPYRKPEVTKVPLRPEEATLGDCKTDSSAGPAFTDCDTLSCSSIGS